MLAPEQVYGQALPSLKERMRHATTMPVVVLPAPIWQLKMMGSVCRTARMPSWKVSKTSSRGAEPSVMGTRL